MNDQPIHVIVESIRVDWHPPLTYGAGDPGSFAPRQFVAVARAITPTVEARATVPLTLAEQQEARALVERIAARLLADRERAFELG